MFHFDSSNHKIFPCLAFLFGDRSWAHGAFGFIYRPDHFDPGRDRESFGV